MEFEYLLATKSIQAKGSQSDKELFRAIVAIASMKASLVSYQAKMATLEMQMKHVNIIYNNQTSKANDILENPLDDLPDLQIKLTEARGSIEKSQTEQIESISEGDVKSFFRFRKIAVSNRRGITMKSLEFI